MKKPKVVSLAEENSLIRVGHGSLMDRVVSILEQARTQCCPIREQQHGHRVLASRHEIVVALQGGEARGYGRELLGDLSEQLIETI